MLDNQIIIALGAVLNPRLAARGVLAEVKQGNQPTAQGIPEGALISLYKIADKRYGFPEDSTEWDANAEVMRQTLSEQVESTFQFTCVVPQDPKFNFQLTAADVLKIAARILQSPSGRIALRENGLGVLRVQDIRTGYVKDDRSQFMANPTFDIVLTHRDTEVDIIGIVTSQEVNISRV